MSKKKWLITLGIIASLAVVLGVGYLLGIGQGPPPMPTNSDEIVKLATSRRFAKMSPAQRRPYLDKMVALTEDMSLVDRMKLVKQVLDIAKDHPDIMNSLMQSQLGVMEAKARKFELADANAKKKILDTDIDRMELMRKMRDMLGAGGDSKKSDSPPPGPPPGAAIDFKKQMLDSVQHGNPQTQAYIAEYFQAIRQRRTERGLSPDPVMGGGRR